MTLSFPPLTNAFPFLLKGCLDLISTLSPLAMLPGANSAALSGLSRLLED